MAEVTSRIELKEYALRDLGYPVIEINVADQQLEDRLDDALQYFNEWHFEGCEKLYLKHQLTGSKLRFTASAANVFDLGETLTGATSGATAVFEKVETDPRYIEVWQTKGTFVPGEVVTGRRGSRVTVITNDAFVKGDLDNQYIDIPNTIMSIVKIFPVSSVLSSNFLFNSAYYFLYDAMWNFSGMDLISYELMKERVNQINQMFTGEKPIRYNRKLEKLYVDFDWSEAVRPGSFLVIECYRILDPNSVPKVWNDYFLKRYTVALFKIQWGENLIKFENIQLPGGVVLNGSKILEEGKEAKRELEEQMVNGRWCEPITFQMA